MSLFPTPQEAADRLGELFPTAYLALHRRDGKRSELTGAPRAVLQHLARSGPLTIGEAANHLARAQSVVSDIVTQLEGHGLLERLRDPADRRRTLVWLTDAGRRRLAEDQQVLDRRLVAEAMSRLPGPTRLALLDGHSQLVGHAVTRPLAHAASTPHPCPTTPTKESPMTTITTCESCGMPIESGPYCEHCVDAGGRLQDFDTRFERMVGWAQRKGADRASAEAQTREYMRGMPVWRDHPHLAERP
ncbi:MAG TPA: MarR family transcriptional regulator [Dermatophilaceae bacterium]|nr:MarR family transcriptional regulator [Dermatophilaceae bacterium]